MLRCSPAFSQSVCSAPEYLCSLFPNEDGSGITSYSFEFMTGPSYIPLPYCVSWAYEKMGVSLDEWLRTGYIGISVNAGIWHNRREDFFENVSIAYAIPGGQGSYIHSKLLRLRAGAGYQCPGNHSPVIADYMRIVSRPDLNTDCARCCPVKGIYRVDITHRRGP